MYTVYISVYDVIIYTVRMYTVYISVYDVIIYTVHMYTVYISVYDVIIYTVHIMYSTLKGQGQRAVAVAEGARG